MLWFQKNIWALCDKRQWIGRQQNKLKKVEGRKSLKKTLTTLIIVERLTKKELTKQKQTNFIVVWSSIIIRKVEDIFDYNFKEGMQAHLLRYMGMNLGLTTKVQKQAQQWSRTQMETRREVVAFL